MIFKKPHISFIYRKFCLYHKLEFMTSLLDEIHVCCNVFIIYAFFFHNTVWHSLILGSLHVRELFESISGFPRIQGFERDITTWCRFSEVDCFSHLVLQCNNSQQPVDL